MTHTPRQVVTLTSKILGLLLSGGVLTLGFAIASGLVDWGTSRAEAAQFKAHLAKAEPMMERFIVTEQVVRELGATNRELLNEVKGLRRDVDRYMGAQGR